MTRAARVVLRLVVSATVLAALALMLDLRVIATALATAHPGWMALAVALLMMQIAVSALRWRLTAARLGLRLTLGRAVGEYFVAVLGNTLLPGGVLGDVSRAVRVREVAGTRPAVLSVVLERVAGQLAMACAALIGLAIWLGAVGSVTLMFGSALSAALALWLMGRVAPRAMALAREVWIDDNAWHLHATLSLIIVGCNIGGVWAAMRAVGVVIGGVEALVFIPPVLMTMLLPVSVNGWGLREAAAAALWPLAGVDPAQAVAGSVAFGLAAIFAALPGLVVLTFPPEVPSV